MKLSSFVAIAAVIGGSFLIPNSAEARSPWNKVETSRGASVYVKDITCRSHFCEYDFSDGGSVVQHQINCNDWTMRPKGIKGNDSYYEWGDILPASMTGSAAEYACNRM